VRVVAAAGARGAVDGRRPGVRVARVVGPRRERDPQALVAREAARHAALLARAARDGRDAGFGREVGVGGVAPAVVAELGEELRRVDGPRAGEGLHERPVGVGGELRGDPRLERAELVEERAEHRDEGAHEVPARVRLEGAGVAGRGGAEAREELGRGSTSRVPVPREEAREAARGEPRRVRRRRVRIEEGEADRAVDVGEESRGAGPRGLEQRAELVGEADAGRDQVVARAHGGPEGAGRVARRLEAGEAVAVGAQQVGRDVGVGRVALRARARVAGPTRLQRVRVDRDDRVPGLEEGVHEQPRGALEGERQRARRAEAREARAQLGQAGRRVGHAELGHAPAGRRVEDTDVVVVAGPVNPAAVR